MSEKRLYKMQLMLSDTELKEIDDFRFEERAESRAAAVRTLIKQGLSNWKQTDDKRDTDAV